MVLDEDLGYTTIRKGEVLMKLEIFKNMIIPETLIKIYTAQPIDHKTQQVIDLVKGTTTTNYVRAFWMEKLYFLPPKDISRIYTDGKKVCLETTDKVYTSKLRLYQLEQELPENFVRISHSEIVNIDYIKRLNLNLKGTIEITLTTGQTSFVSRRSLKNVKKALGI